MMLLKNVLSENRIRILSFALLVMLWGALSRYMNDPQMLPAPWAVLKEMNALWQIGKLQSNLWATLGRVFFSFIFAMGIGVVLGYMMGRFKPFNAWLDPWLIVFLNLPALIIIVLCLIWIGLNETAVICAVTLNKVPLVTTLIREAARNASRELDDLARVFCLSPIARLRHIVLPELFPALAGAGRAGLSVIWKIVLVVEFLGGSSGRGIGLQIHTQFSMFNVTGVLAYALSFVAVVLIVEFVILHPAERWATRWRANADT